MKAWIRNILVGILCVVILLVLAIGVHNNVFEPKLGVLNVAEDVNRAEVTYEDGVVYAVEGEQVKQLAEFFRNLEAVEYDSGTKGEESGIVIQFFTNEVKKDGFCITDHETIVDYSDEEENFATVIYKTETDLEEYLRGLK